MKIAFVLGEESADRIAADLARALRRRVRDDLQLVGLGGAMMQEEGLASLFDIEELSIIGLGGILVRLPQLMRRLSQTAEAILAEAPDAVVTIDSFTFTNRVASRIRRARPEMPIVNIVPPAVWAYRPKRVKALKAAVDHAICLFPFEPAFLEQLGGPPATYVGHPLMSEPHLSAIGARLAADPVPLAGSSPKLLILPGSRRGEIERLMDDFGRTYAFLKKRMPSLSAVLPAVPRVRSLVERKLEGWEHRPEVVSGEDEKWQAFGSTDAALAASGTVALELALAGVPTVVAYRLDPVAYAIRHIITGWTAVLPNLIADHPLIPEHFHEFVRADLLGRRLERLLTDTPERRAQLLGFADVRRLMAVDRPPGEAAADIVLAQIEARRA
ncbi:lipid-A-disaccharide synthase [Aureimonas populi]|uniref:Lipid-A-disaccharide synthase n=1 Tax=Aureimonas populi TaxID=1701758 RepID=A0ABW5CQK7_9HYPH|nr:lipid-A-disaccharide synthase [Aureimonas populi]